MLKPIDPKPIEQKIVDAISEKLKISLYFTPYGWQTSFIYNPEDGEMLESGYIEADIRTHVRFKPLRSIAIFNADHGVSPDWEITISVLYDPNDLDTLAERYSSFLASVADFYHYSIRAGE